jgi:hypothetical protein
MTKMPPSVTASIESRNHQLPVSPPMVPESSVRMSDIQAIWMKPTRPPPSSDGAMPVIQTSGGQPDDDRQRQAGEPEDQDQRARATASGRRRKQGVHGTRVSSSRLPNERQRIGDDSIATLRPRGPACSRGRSDRAQPAPFGPYVSQA